MTIIYALIPCIPSLLCRLKCSYPHPKWCGLKPKTDWLLVGGAAVAVSEAPVLGDPGVDPLIDMGLGPVVGPPELLLRGPPGLLVLRPLEEVKEGPRLKKQGIQVFKTTAVRSYQRFICLRFLLAKRKTG